ncbi:hypothetical protein ACFPZL_01385 [Leucobacter soli]|uniref:Uncharacterized protein n=1 Tax=Leucobacter soli TaxID=2812850 RepID=A0A916K023_9MICO|nr:hypothetical protein [Leucobacter soli]CAG7614121.1 hypothetical protein LEUCIP111803_01758 [Leucobacter soli]
MSEDRPHERRRGVTRGYVVGLVAATVMVALALVVASWGILGMVLRREPVDTPGLGLAAAELILLPALAALALGLWLQTLVLLRGRRTPPWAHVIVLGGGAYFIWCLGGVLAGMPISDTWLSPFALALALTWALCSLLFWAVLARRVYTQRPVPKWPWEKRGDEEGPDWRRPESDGEDPR